MHCRVYVTTIICQDGTLVLELRIVSFALCLHLPCHLAEKVKHCPTVRLGICRAGLT